jgi:hypothetical protein
MLQAVLLQAFSRTLRAVRQFGRETATSPCQHFERLKFVFAEQLFKQ